MLCTSMDGLLPGKISAGKECYKMGPDPLSYNQQRTLLESVPF